MSDEPVGERSHVIAVTGELDADSHNQVRDLIARLSDQGKVRLVIDLSQASFLDSSALSGLVACSRRLRTQGGLLALVAGRAHRQPSERFDLTGTREVLNVCESRDEAVSLVEAAGTAVAPPADRVKLRLYVNGRSPRSRYAIAELRALSDRLPAGADVEVVDLALQPEVAERERLIATPVLVRTDPPPVRRIVGDLSDHTMVLRALELAPAQDGVR